MAFKSSLTTFMKVAGMGFRSRPTIAVWDIENTQVPRGLKVADVVHNIRTNLQEAGFDYKVPLHSYCHFPSVKKGIRAGLKKQGLNIKNVPETKADENISSFVREWAKENPDGGNVILLSGDMELAKNCDGGPLFDLYIAARTERLKTTYLRNVKPLGFWRCPDMFTSTNAKLVPPKVIEKEIEERCREKEKKRKPQKNKREAALKEGRKLGRQKKN